MPTILALQDDGFTPRRQAPGAGAPLGGDAATRSSRTAWICRAR